MINDKSKIVFNFSISIFSINWSYLFLYNEDSSEAKPSNSLLSPIWLNFSESLLISKITDSLLRFCSIKYLSKKSSFNNSP